MIEKKTEKCQEGMTGKETAELDHIRESVRAG